jgi:hypothetical protein
VWVDQNIKESDLLQELINSVENTRTINQSFMYWEAAAAMRWHNLCNNPSYSLYSISKQLLLREVASMLKIMFSETATRAFDFVNLGTGGGEKDTIILSNLLNAAQGDKIRYIALDKSYSMLSDAVNFVLQFFRSQSGRANWEAAAILGDILTLERYRPIIHQGYNPKLYALLGNLIGNLDETDVLTRISKVMDDSDLLLLDADLIAGRKDDELDFGYKIDDVKELMIRPIIEHLASHDQELADSFRNATISTEIRRRGSKVPNSKRVQVCLHDSKGNKYEHAFSTKYDLPSLKDYLKSAMGFRILKSSVWRDSKTRRARYVNLLLAKRMD